MEKLSAASISKETADKLIDFIEGRRESIVTKKHLDLRLNALKDYLDTKVEAMSQNVDAKMKAKIGELRGGIGDMKWDFGTGIGGLYTVLGVILAELLRAF